VKYPLDILLAGRSKSGLENIERLLEQYGGVDLTLKLVSNGHSDPLHNVTRQHEILIFVIGENWEEGLAALANRPPAQRPHTLVVGPDGDIAQYRGAMRAGARDYIVEPVSGEELAKALDQITQELQSQRSRKAADLVVVMNTKGGSGASMIASNIAYIDATETERRTLLVDMDLQFGALPSYLNLSFNNGLMKALKDVEHLDAAALDGLVLKHSDGLRVLAASPEDLVLNEEIPQPRVASLFRLLGDSYEKIIVDMPRQIDAISSLILQHADKILLVMEASLAHTRDAKRLLQILHQVLGVPRDRIKIVVNRYDKSGSVRSGDVRDALGFDEVSTLPSDFKRVNHSINIGSPLLHAARSAPITRGMMQLAHSLRSAKEQQALEKPGSRLFAWARPSRDRL
jgi:pilus assembly protein CpaE